MNFSALLFGGCLFKTFFIHVYEKIGLWSPFSLSSYCLGVELLISGQSTFTGELKLVWSQPPLPLMRVYKAMEHSCKQYCFFANSREWITDLCFPPTHSSADENLGRFWKGLESWYTTSQIANLWFKIAFFCNFKTKMLLLNQISRILDVFSEGSSGLN